MESVDNFIEIIRRLRDKNNGCPWDREQTHESIRGHLVEECAEFLDAVDMKNYPNMCEELGDILMHIALHSQIADEEGKFNFEDVVKEISDKIVRRHPHVFGELHADKASDVVKIWSDVKAVEKKSRPKSSNFWENIPAELSALRKAKDVAKHLTDEEKSTLASKFDAKTPEEKCGQELFEVVSKYRELGVEPEGALRDYILYLRKNTDPNFVK